MKRYPGKPASNNRSPGETKSIGALVERLMARRGYAQIFATEGLQASVEASIDQRLIGSVRVGKLRAGVLSIHASDSVTLQELHFAKSKVLTRLQADHPDSKIRDIRFQVTPWIRK